MKEDITAQGFKRVVVAFDASPQGRALLEFAGELAACFGSALAGVFLEDRSAGALAALPMAREVSLGSAELRALDLERAVAHQRAQLSLARRTLADVAQARHLASSFTVHHDVDEVAQALADAGDLLMVCPRIWPGPIPLAQERLQGLRHGPAGGLLTLEAMRRKGRPSPVAVILGENAAADSGLLSISHALASHLGTAIELFAPRSLAALESLREQAIGAALPRPAMRLRPFRSGEAVAARVALASPALVVLSSGESEGEVQALLTEGLSLLMLRELTTA
jgi:hypothetical protein